MPEGTINITTYDAQGRITLNVQCGVDVVGKYAEDCCGVLFGIYDGTDYYVDVTTGEPVEKPELPLVFDKVTMVADGDDSCTCTGIPVGTQLTVSEEGDVFADENVDDGEFALDVDEPGSYELFFLHPFHKPQLVTINAT